MDFSIEQFLVQLDLWVSEKKTSGMLPSGYKIGKTRIEYVFETADKQFAEHYFGYADKASPFKKIACFCYAIAMERPFFAPNTVDGDGWVEVAELNAEFALDFSSYLASISSFDCAPEIEPPFDIKFPSQHFRNEMKKNLVWGKLTSPGIALIFELLIYHGEKGSRLVRRLDRAPVRVTDRLPISP